MRDVRRLLPLLPVALVLGSCQYIDPPKDTRTSPDDLVDWSPTRKLTWDDFRGQPAEAPDDVTVSRLRAGCSVGGVRHAVVPVGKWKVRCAMNRRQSWVKKGEATAERLAYHQAEFDLYELHARKLRKKFAETDFGVVDPGG